MIQSKLRICFCLINGKDRFNRCGWRDAWVRFSTMTYWKWNGINTRDDPAAFDQEALERRRVVFRIDPTDLRALRKIGPRISCNSQNHAKISITILTVLCEMVLYRLLLLLGKIRYDEVKPFYWTKLLRWSVRSKTTQSLLKYMRLVCRRRCLTPRI